MREEVLTRIREVLTERVCSVCTDRRIDGTCALPRACPLDERLVEIIQAVASTNSEHIRDYMEAVREHVCAVCTGQDDDGRCQFRENVDCALDAYLVLVVEATEEGIRRLGGRRAVLRELGQ